MRLVRAKSPMPVHVTDFAFIGVREGKDVQPVMVEIASRDGDILRVVVITEGSPIPFLTKMTVDADQILALGGTHMSAETATELAVEDKPELYIVLWQHRHGTNSYVVRSTGVPGKQQLIDRLSMDFEEDREEYIDVVKVDEIIDLDKL